MLKCMLKTYANYTVNALYKLLYRRVMETGKIDRTCLKLMSKDTTNLEGDLIYAWQNHVLMHTCIQSQSSIDTLT